VQADVNSTAEGNEHEHTATDEDEKAKATAAAILAASVAEEMLRRLGFQRIGHAAERR
jgi:hypothetical protein